MPKKKFQATEGLLHDVMRKQSGVIEKAWLESLMNSVDANATHWEAEITEEKTIISDDGDSMTSEDVEKYFEQFGLKDDDIEDKEFGKFRMGRGQIFNFGVNIWRAKENYMVVSLDDSEVSVRLQDCTDEDDESIKSYDNGWYTIDTEGLGYALLSAEEIDSGLSIEVQHYNAIDDLEGTISEFKKLARYVGWLHDIEVVINGDTLDDEPEVVEETEKAWYVEGERGYSNRSPVYNKGAYVDSFSLGPRKVAIITKDDLDVTLDRTDILETDEYWQALKAEHEEIVTDQLVEDNELSSNERNWLIEKAANNAQLIQLIQDKPLLEDINNEMWTLSGLATKNIGFSDQKDKVAKDAMSKARVVILKSIHEDALNTFVESAQETIEDSNLKTYSDIVEDELVFEMKMTPDEELSKRRLKNLRQIRSALQDMGFRDEVVAGYSNHKDVWKDDEDTLFIHKDMLNSNKDDLVTEVFFEVVRVAAHNGDTRAGMSEDYNLSKNFYKMMTGQRVFSDFNFPEVQQKLMNGHYE